MKYDMLCEKCGEVEIEHPMAEDHPKKHTCGAPMQRRIVSVPGMKLVGSGFYNNDKALYEDKDAQLEAKLARRSKGIDD